jgi:hypothetical protein
MSTAPDNDKGTLDEETERQARAMKDQLRRDVASWSAARSEGSARGAAEEITVPITKPTPVQPSARVKRPTPASPDVNKAASGPKKPFSMSYDGVTAKDYITYMLARGAR